MEINRSGLPENLFFQEEGVPVVDGDQNRLTQEDFFSLLTTELANQDPTAPVDNNQMISQITGFTQADSLNQLNEQFSDFASSISSGQALQASGLIGQQVLVQGNTGFLPPGGELSGVVVSDTNIQNLQLTVENEVGQTVRTFNLGDQRGGNINFAWNGTDEQGNTLPPGNYTFRATGGINGETQELGVATRRQVNSVSLAGSQGVILNLFGDDSITLNDVIEIGG